MFLTTRGCIAAYLFLPSSVSPFAAGLCAGFPPGTVSHLDDVSRGFFSISRLIHVWSPSVSGEFSHSVEGCGACVPPRDSGEFLLPPLAESLGRKGSVAWCCVRDPAFTFSLCANAGQYISR